MAAVSPPGPAPRLWATSLAAAAIKRVVAAYRAEGTTDPNQGADAPP